MASKIVGGTLGAVGKIGGGILGALAPFKKGGKVKGKKGTPKVILAHAGEVVVPNSLPAVQKSALKAINKHKKEKK